jgi:hypothetical protein
MQVNRRHVAAVCAVLFAAFTMATWGSTTGPGTTGNADAANPATPIEVTIDRAPLDQAATPVAPAATGPPMEVPEAPLKDPAPASSASADRGEKRPTHRLHGHKHS